MARVMREARQGSGPAFAIVPLNFSHAVGQIRFFGRRRAERTAEIGYWLQRRHWGKGFGTEAVWLACAYGISRMRLHRIVAKVVDGNRRSTQVVKHVGFRLEARSRGTFRLGDRWVDELEFGLLSAELKEPRRTSRPRSKQRDRL